jgi:predicted metalloprotease with PDZ domain
MRVAQDTLREPRLGLQTAADSSGIIVTGLAPGGAAQEAGVQVGDRVLSLGDLSLSDPDFGPAFRARFGKQEGAPLPIKVRRGNDTLTLNSKVRLVARVERRFEIDPSASAKAVRIRNGILKGVVGK